ncbi:MAG: TraB/GumN family protein, partial [Myxococcota bacterium]
MTQTSSSVPAPPSPPRGVALATSESGDDGGPPLRPAPEGPPRAYPLPETVGSSPSNTSLRLVRADGGETTVHIIGTAHVSRASVEEVQEVIRALRPDTVCVELDPMRYEALTDPTRWRKLDIFQVIREKKVLFLLANLALQSFQKRLGDQMGVKPGAELLAAVETAKEVGAEVQLSDRHIQITLRRTWSALSFVERTKLVGLLAGSVVGGEEISEEQIEQLKEREHFSDAMSELAKHMPSVRRPLIEERDEYLISGVREAPGASVVAVVGAGHVAGMLKNVETPIDRDELDVLPKPSLAGKLLKWVIPAIILAAFSYGYSQHQGESLERMIYAWVLPNAIVAALLTLLAGGKLLSVVAAFFASPITSLNPTIGAGMVVGLVEAWLRKPTVEDCERLSEDATTLEGMRRNPFTRILIVAVAAT